MNIGIHIQTNILFFLFCLLLYDQQRQHKVFDFLGSTTFNSLLGACMFIMAVDCVSWLMMADILPHTPQQLMLVQSFYYMIQAVIPMFFLIYCYNTSGRKIHKYSYPLVYLAAIITIVVLVNNYFHGFAFYVSGTPRRSRYSCLACSRCSSVGAVLY